MPTTLPCDAIFSNTSPDPVPSHQMLLCCPASSVPAGLEVESALVLQPPTVSGHTTDLLAVVVWWWVGKGRGCGVDSVALDAVEEAGVLRCKFCEYPSISQTKHLVAEDRSNQPAHGQHAQCAQSHEHEWVEASELSGERSIIAIAHHSCEAVVCDTDSSHNGASLPDPSARSAEGEEVVPCELRLRCRWGTSWRLRCRR